MEDPEEEESIPLNGFVIGARIGCEKSVPDILDFPPKEPDWKLFEWRPAEEDNGGCIPEPILMLVPQTKLSVTYLMEVI